MKKNVIGAAEKTQKRQDALRRQRRRQRRKEDECQRRNADEKPREYAEQRGRRCKGRKNKDKTLKNARNEGEA